MIKLKPCPFCGGKPYMAQNYLGQKYVSCPECGACVWGKDTDDWRIAKMGEKKAEKAAAEAWNRRAKMTTEEAIKILEAAKAGIEWTAPLEYQEAFDMAIDALNTLPSAQPDIIHCKDCIHWMPHTQLGRDEDDDEHHDYCARLVPEDEYYAFTRDADDFCSRAKRKEMANDSD